MLKYDIRRFTISYCKQRTKKDEQEGKYLENKQKQNLENVLDNDGNLENYRNIKGKIKEIYEKKAKGARIRSKSLWYEEGEKSLKFFLNLEKRRGIQGQILFLETRQETLLKTAENFLNEVFVPKLNYEDARICQGNLNELELLKARKSIPNNKSYEMTD